MIFGLSDHTVNILRETFRRYPEVEQVVIYGSRAMGTYKTGSDIDLTLIGDQLTHETLLQIAQDLDEAPIPYTVDLSIYHDIRDGNVRDHIRRRGMVFYQKAGANE
ncbi:MAG: nucleotidyltransferase domain-containing protein [Firmicutes bacterium]|nr:nucleotidyltransferase domain-containing protein [Bacillota bacterium]